MIKDTLPKSSLEATPRFLQFSFTTRTVLSALLVPKLSVKVFNSELKKKDGPKLNGQQCFHDYASLNNAK